MSHQEESQMIDPIVRLISLGLIIPALPFTVPAEYAMEKLTHKPFSEIPEEKRNPAVVSLAKEIAENKESYRNMINEGSKKAPSQEETDKKIDHLLGSINEHTNFQAGLLKPMMERLHKSGHLKLEPGEDEMGVMKQLFSRSNSGNGFNDIKLNLAAGLAYRIGNIENEYFEQKKRPEYSVLAGPVIRDLVNNTAAEIKKGPPQVTFGHIEDSRSANIKNMKPALQEQARDAAPNGVNVTTAPNNGGPATTGNNPQLLAEQAKGRK